MNHFAGWLLLLFGSTLVLLTISLLLRRGLGPGERYTTPARFFLVVLRLAIGWHFLIEGLEKFHTPNWSGEAYLRESYGPFAGAYRTIAGDRLVDQLAMPAAEKGAKNAGPQPLPPALDADWQAYLDAFAAHYDLDAEATGRAADLLRQAKSNTATWLTEGTEEVVRPAAYPPELKVKLTMPQRLDLYAKLKALAAEAEAALPTSDPDAHKRWKDAKADLAKWRAGLKKSLDGQADQMKDALKAALRDPNDVEADERRAVRLRPAAVQFLGLLGPAPGQGPLPAFTALPWDLPAARPLSAREMKSPPPADAVRRPVATWTLLDWSDIGVKWGLAAIGTLLLAGLFSRLASAAGALLVLSFYLAMPPLPGWPEVPRLEGHYLLINKTLIEVLALAALTFIPTGRWLGVDALIQVLRPSSWRRAEARPDAPARAVAVPNEPAQPVA